MTAHENRKAPIAATPKPRELDALQQRRAEAGGSIVSTHHDDLHDRPIPPAQTGTESRGYHGVPIDGADPRADDTLVCVSDHCIASIAYYHLSDGTNVHYGHRIAGSIPDVLARRGLVPMLKHANAPLRRYGCALVVYDAFRPVAAQRGLWDWTKSRIAQENPILSDEAILAMTARFCSDPCEFDPANPMTWPTHATGCAVDVMLHCLSDGAPLDMGCGFDTFGPVAQTDFFERQFVQNKTSRDTPSVIHRRLLYNAMTLAGFANYSAEFWHYDFGNQMHAHNSGRTDAAWYGYVPPPRSTSAPAGY